MNIFVQIDAALGGKNAQSINKIILWIQKSGVDEFWDILKQGGLSEEAQSWLSDEENQLNVSVEQVQKALGKETIQQLALKIGKDSHTASTLLAQYLPQMLQTVMASQIHKNK
ncbi:YidB family protein [Neisseria sp. Ec49-e6-T10]|uniref:YidB family protein n=1 Tax=Neisseria sp. Ec49-e6-T10 TaxID=3140744 RepID=UPI003EB891D4